MSAQVICVYNNQEIFDKVVINNENLKNCKFFVYDNSKENIAITKHYNHYIENIGHGIIDDAPMDTNDYWCLFIHQDFGILENIDPILKKLNKNNIYGAVGIKILKGLFFGKCGTKRKLGFKNELKLTFGRILQGNNDFNFQKHGLKAFLQPSVNAIDCCCILIHSSIIKKYNLRFDENLDFHMYAEELCYRAKQEHNIKTKVVQLKCFHLGKGHVDAHFQRSTQYLKAKFKIKNIPSTCAN